MFYDNFVRLCNKVNKSPSCVATEIGLSRASVNGWKNGKKPTDATTLKLADYFGVPVDELLGNTEQKEKASIPKDEREITLDDFTFAMQNETKDLTDMDKQILLSMARQLNDARKKKNGDPE